VDICLCGEKTWRLTLCEGATARWWRERPAGAPADEGAGPHRLTAQVRRRSHDEEIARQRDGAAEVQGAGACGGDRIGQVTIGVTCTEYAILTANAYPSGITVGPDSALWAYCMRRRRRASQPAVLSNRARAVKPAGESAGTCTNAGCASKAPTSQTLVPGGKRASPR
jgi:hypothetical protein